MAKIDPLERLREVKAAHQAALMDKANVVGVGIGLKERGGKLTDEPAIVVSVDRKLPSGEVSAEDEIPSELDGVPVDVQVVGDLRALQGQ